MEDEFKKIVKMLEANNFEFSVMRHEPVFTSEEAAKVRGAELKQGVKAMVFKHKNEFLIALVPADRKVDTKKLKKIAGGKVKLATPEEVFNITNCRIGAVPPFGHKTNLKTIADPEIFSCEWVNFNAGLNTESIKMKGSDLKKVLEGMHAEFCEIKL